MLKVNINSGKDYLEYLRPFVIHTLSLAEKDSSVTDADVSQKIREIFGLEIPARTTQILLQRLAKEQFLKKSHGRYIVAGELPNTDSLLQEKASAERKINAVSLKLADFAKNQYNLDLSEEEALDAITLFLSKFSISCLKSFLRGTALPNHLKETNQKLNLVSKFLERIERSEPYFFEDFILLVKGHMLANALICPDLNFSSKSYEGVSFFLDTPVLLQVIGLDGDKNKQVAKELVKQLTSLGGTVNYFSHTLEELENTIKSSAEFIDSIDGKGSIVFEARKSNLRKSDLIIIAEKARDTLENLAISYKPTPPYSKKYQIDETRFDEMLEKEINYNNPKARADDVNSVRSIYTLRKGAQPRKIENSKAVLITTNSSFASAAFEYGKTVENSPEVSPVITDFSIANIAWLKAPLGAPLLPQKEVMAFAYATARPTDEFLHQVIKEADKLESTGSISARDHQILRSSYHAQEALNDLTLGEEASLNESTLLRALEIAENEIKKEENQKLIAEKALHEATKSELIENRENMANIQRNMYWSTRKKAYLRTNTTYIILIVAISLGATTGINPYLNEFFPSLLSSIFTLASVLGLIFGVSANQARKWTASLYHRHLFIRGCESLGIPISSLEAIGVQGEENQPNAETAMNNKALRIKA